VWGFNSPRHTPNPNTAGQPSFGARHDHRPHTRVVANEGLCARSGPPVYSLIRWRSTPRLSPAGARPPTMRRHWLKVLGSRVVASRSSRRNETRSPRACGGKAGVATDAPAAADASPHDCAFDIRASPAESNHLSRNASRLAADTATRLVVGKGARRGRGSVPRTFRWYTEGFEGSTVDYRGGRVESAEGR
jgi:hypothetical protein